MTGFEENLAPLVSLADFGENITVASVAVNAVLDWGYAETLRIEGLRLMALCVASDLPAGTAFGTAVVARGGTYRVVGIMQDITEKMKTLVLEKAA